MDCRKIAMLVAGSCALAFGGWDFVPEGSWADFGDARSKALGSVWWTDSTHINLWALDANPAGLVGNGGSPLTASYLATGTTLEGGNGELSHFEPVHLQLGSSKANSYAFQAHLIDISETWKDSNGTPKYELSRLRWGFDAAVSLSDNRSLVFGLGMDGRFPGSQTQDTSGTRAGGTYEHLQIGLEALRLGMAVRIAQAVAIGLTGSVGIDVDSLQFTGNASTGNSFPQLRFAEATLPMIGLGVAVDRADWPVSGTLLFDWGMRSRIGVLKDQPSNVNRDLPQLSTDTMRFALAVQGRPDLRIPDQNLRPVFAIHWTNSSVQAYEPTPGTSNPLSHGAKMPDSAWSIRRTGLVLGLDWTWMDRIAARTEGEVVLEGLTAKNGLFAPGASGDTTLSATDSRWAIGVEFSHALVPAWREAIPKGDGFCLRLGFSYQSLGGLGLEPGWFSGLQAGTEPGAGTGASTYQQAATLAQLGMYPNLGARSSLRSITWGLGGWILDRSLMADLGFSWNSWTPGTRDSRTGLGWTTQLSYRM